MADNQTSTSNALLDIINTVGQEAKPNPAPSTKPGPAGSVGISKPASTIKVDLSKFIGGKK